MNAFSLNPDIGIIANSTVKNRYQKLQKLLDKISNKKLSDKSIKLINKELDALNSSPLEANKLEKHLKKAYSNIEDIVSKDSKSGSSFFKKLTRTLGIGALAYAVSQNSQKSIEENKQD